ncbi:alpha/beta fold hydrolase [Rheinheimera sp. UJ63]|uniref:alpha/beta fold hydrolase n=1 Tax=Rheinheimera sp. UJ63 TaxID=2910157 RepID=UPI001F362A0E|nr:alpha/beta fold hydrolase [Rheinheimera sp. UJ63]MCF4008835.1 alpha/beta fold hydrolase [Rheinheimera sp. UJ63]
MTKSLISIVLLLVLTPIVSCANSTTNTSNDTLVVIAHGFGRSDWAMWRLAQRLRNAKYNVCLLDYATIGQSVSAVLAETTKQIDACVHQASEVHFVGHSLGGLVIRAYLQNNKHKLENIKMGNVVLIGTPNKGSELADYLNGSWLMHIGGDISRALMTGNNSLGINLQELEVNIGVIAGTHSSKLTRNQFKGPNDGLVSVESTKLGNMTDFITFDVGHSQMRNNFEVSKQTIHFLQNGFFKH